MIFLFSVAHVLIGLLITVNDGITPLDLAREISPNGRRPGNLEIGISVGSFVAFMLLWPIALAWRAARTLKHRAKVGRVLLPLEPSSGMTE